MMYIILIITVIYIVGIIISFIEFKGKESNKEAIIPSLFFAVCWPIIFGYIWYVRLKDYLNK